MKSYLRSIRAVPLLSAEEEQRLARAYRHSGDSAAAHQLVTANLRFVVRIARQYVTSRVRMADLVQEGNIGLMAAVERFDPEMGVRLVHYASWWIRACIRRFTLRSSSLVRPGSAPAERLRAAHGDLPLGAPAEGGRSPALELVPYEGPSPHDDLSQAEERVALRTRVADALARLSDRERLLVDMRLMRDEPMSLRQVGAHLGCSHARVHQLQARARSKLRQHLQTSGAAGEAW